MIYTCKELRERREIIGLDDRPKSQKRIRQQQGDADRDNFRKWRESGYKKDGKMPLANR